MNRTWLALWVVAALLLGPSGLAGAADGSLARVKKAGVLTVCAVDGLLPYSSSDQRTPGFEVEIAQAIA
ncbi:MAG: quinoprotein dehydrogenase-associated putative ABC transporter substrate-binding protein, partial [Armatimonadota bacterium]|nr:quinoprotein dehydrogenase-associated putative ABC transporter substrate-binding protein [Armatimonadota bacterium]